MRFVINRGFSSVKYSVVEFSEWVGRLMFSPVEFDDTCQYFAVDYFFRSEFIFNG